MVVKPAANFTQGRRGVVQPGLKVRGRECLRITYGPDYTGRSTSSGCATATSGARAASPSAGTPSGWRRLTTQPGASRCGSPSSPSSPSGPSPSPAAVDVGVRRPYASDQPLPVGVEVLPGASPTAPGGDRSPAGPRRRPPEGDRRRSRLVVHDPHGAICARGSVAEASRPPAGLRRTCRPVTVSPEPRRAVTADRRRRGRVVRALWPCRVPARGAMTQA